MGVGDPRVGLWGMLCVVWGEGEGRSVSVGCGGCWAESWGSCA